MAVKEMVRITYRALDFGIDWEEGGSLAGGRLNASGGDLGGRISRICNDSMN